jgi:hypothetical protein
MIPDTFSGYISANLIIAEDESAEGYDYSNTEQKRKEKIDSNVRT